MTYEELNSVITAILNMRESASDEIALASKDLYSTWRVDISYTLNDRVKYDGVLYKCLRNHVAQSEWAPTNAPSLWTKVLIPDPEVIPEWEQPESTNPYMMGDKVTHNGKTWESTIDNNVWEPGVYGWSEVTA